MRQRTELGKLLAKRRVDLGMTQREMAAEIGASAPFLSAVEYGWKKMPANKAEMLHDLYFAHCPKLSEAFLRAFCMDYMDVDTPGVEFVSKALAVYWRQL
jgi:hypothetical protein